MNKKTKVLGFLLSLLGVWHLALADGPFLSVQNSLAGEESNAKISGLFSNESFSFALSRPDGSQIKIPSLADGDGRAEVSLSGLHLQKAGKYTAEITRDFGEKIADFQVLAGPVSAYRSTLEVKTPALSANGKTSSVMTLSLHDAFGNPLSGISATLFSSRNGDKIVAEARTNAAGVLQAQVSSVKPGVSVLSAVANGIVIFQKPEIVFFLPDSDNLPFMGADGEETWGQYLKAQLFENQDSADVSYFTFENAGADATVGKTFTAKVSARDANGDVVTGYRGTVRFSSSDDRADLPADYRFTPEDLGEHSFFLAFTFQTPGAQTLAVHDLGDFRISGEASFTVNLGEGGTEVGTSDTSLQLLTPRPGVYRLSRLTITGEAKGCETVKITDGPTVLAPELKVDPRGNFLLQTPRLGDGVHIFQATCVTDENVKSNELTVRVDQTAPEGISVAVIPEGDLKAGQAFQVLVTGTEPLSGAKSVFQGVLTDHKVEGEAWVANLTAPNVCGEFTVDVTALDVIGNEKEFPAAGVIRVVGCEETAGVGEGEGGGAGGAGTEGGGDSVLPTAVDNISSQSGEGKVTLFWSPADDNDGIKNYRVDFGCREIGSDAEMVLDRSNLTPDNRTQWYVDQIAPNEECDFKVIPIDMTGNEGPASAAFRAMTAEGEALLHASAPEKLEKTGNSNSPVVWVFAILTGLGVILVSRRMARS